MDDLEVIELSAADCQASFSNSSKKRKRAAKAPIIEIPDDDDDDEGDINSLVVSIKQFGTVADYSDHHYRSNYQSMQNSREWAKAIQRDWKILEKDLPPESIFVRGYEGRMEFLRAAIAGAAGTPYHDGLFFFDLLFPPQYPNVPPLVHYHSGGLRLNPNLYACGKVCLSLLNTWSGRREEKWCKNESTVLQVLLSIQALVLNAKPYFNEPGYELSAGTPHGERQARDYNEQTFLLSCKTMLYSLNKPPKHFEELVETHFRARGSAILAACRAYMEGAEVGCLVEGGVQDVDESHGHASQNFKNQVGQIVPSLVAAFGKIGVKDCEKVVNQTNQAAQASRNAAARLWVADYSLEHLQGLGSLLSL